MCHLTPWFGSLGLIIIGTQLGGSASYLGPALAFTLLDFVLPLVLAIEIGRKTRISAAASGGIQTARGSDNRRLRSSKSNAMMAGLARPVTPIAEDSMTASWQLDTHPCSSIYSDL